MCRFALLYFPDAFISFLSCGEWLMSTSETPDVQYVCYSLRHICDAFCNDFIAAQEGDICGPC